MRQSPGASWVRGVGSGRYWDPKSSTLMVVRAARQARRSDPGPRGDFARCSAVSVHCSSRWRSTEAAKPTAVDTVRSCGPVLDHLAILGLVEIAAQIQGGIGQLKRTATTRPVTETQCRERDSVGKATQRRWWPRWPNREIASSP